MEPYYYTKMPKPNQAAYHAMKTGLTSLAPSFQIPLLPAEDLANIFFQLRLDCPEIFYAVSYKIRYYPESTQAEMIPEYIFEKNKIKDHQKMLAARVEKLARPAKTMNEWEKEQYIHDFICENVRYDKLKKPYSHEIIGPLGQGVGVCEGIAKSVKILCDALGIWCIIAISEANPEKGIKYRHAWNVVKIGGKYYHLDATFDNSLGKKSVLAEGETAGTTSDRDKKRHVDANIRYDYFNLSDKQIFRDHEPVIYPIPACTDGEHFYYKEKKISFTKLEDIGKRAQQAIKKNRTLLFHWRGGYLTREVLGEILELLEKTSQEKGRFASVSLNWPQAVLLIRFPELHDESTEVKDGEHTDQNAAVEVDERHSRNVVWEQANEGETL